MVLKLLYPDPEIFGKELSFNPEKIYELSKNKAYLQKELKLIGSVIGIY